MPGARIATCPSCPPSYPPAEAGGYHAPMGHDSTSKLPAWDDLGGTELMQCVVEILVDRAVTDSRINYDRGGKYPQSPVKIARTKSLALAFLSSALGGPLSYNGRSLAEIHKPMAINAG